MATPMPPSRTAATTRSEHQHIKTGGQINMDRSPQHQAEQLHRSPICSEKSSVHGLSGMPGILHMKGPAGRIGYDLQRGRGTGRGDTGAIEGLHEDGIGGGTPVRVEHRELQPARHCVGEQYGGAIALLTVPPAVGCEDRIDADLLFLPQTYNGCGSSSWV